MFCVRMHGRPFTSPGIIPGMLHHAFSCQRDFQLFILLMPEVLFFQSHIFLGKSSEALSSSMVVNVTVTSAVEVSGAITTTEGFYSVVTSMVSPGPTIIVGSPNGSSIAVQASPSAATPGSSGAASFMSTTLRSVQVSVEPTAVSTVKLTTTSSVIGK